MKRITPFAVMLGALTLTACEMPSGTETEAAAPTLPVAATINDEGLSIAAFELFARSRLPGNDLAAMTDEQKGQFLDDLIKLKVLAQDAKNRGWADEAEVSAQLELQTMNLLAQTALRRHLQENPVSDETVNAEVASRAAGSMTAEYKARHILVETKEAADALIAQLDDGADFAELAKEHSTGPTGVNGGDLGWFASDRMVKPFSDAVAAMELKTYTKEPVQTQFGWHVILAEERREVPAAQLERQVRDEMQRAAADSLVTGLVDNAVVVKTAGYASSVPAAPAATN